MDWTIATGSLYSKIHLHHSLEERTVTEDDIDEFRRAMTGAKPLRSEQRVPHESTKPKPRARFARADEQRVLNESLEDDIDTLQHGYGDALRYRRASVGRRTMRKLARGGYSVQAEIDLHGMTLAEAKPRLADFIDYNAMQGNLCVRVVHGKGLRRTKRISAFVLTFLECATSS